MKNFTLAQKQQLEAYEKAGHHVFSTAYDPTKINPAAPANMFEFYRESSTNLVEVIYVSN